jgi:hypothetical protein
VAADAQPSTRRRRRYKVKQQKVRREMQHRSTFETFRCERIKMPKRGGELGFSKI